MGTIASTITNENLAFAKKYNMQYHDFSCSDSINIELFERLNS